MPPRSPYAQLEAGHGDNGALGISAAVEAPDNDRRKRKLHILAFSAILVVSITLIALLASGAHNKRSSGQSQPRYVIMISLGPRLHRRWSMANG